MAKPTEKSVLDTLNNAAGRKDYFEVRVVETADGEVTQIISANGSLVAQVNAIGDAAWKKLEGFTGAGVVDAGSNPTESAENNKRFVSKEGTVAFPTQPEAILPTGETVEIDNRTDADKKAEKEAPTAPVNTGVGSTFSTSGNTSTSK